MVIFLFKIHIFSLPFVCNAVLRIPANRRGGSLFDWAHGFKESAVARLKASSASSQPA